MALEDPEEGARYSAALQAIGEWREQAVHALEKEVDVKSIGKTVERGRALLILYPELEPLREKAALLKRMRNVFTKSHNFDQLEELEKQVSACTYDLGTLRGDFEKKMSEFRTMRSEVCSLLQKVDFNQEHTGLAEIDRLIMECEEKHLLLETEKS